MRTGAAAGHTGCFHQAAVYGTDDELLRLVVPHLQAAVAAGEPVFAALPDAQAELVRAAMNGATPNVTFLPALTEGRPPATIKMLRSLGDLATGDAEQVRVVGAVPHPGLGAPWDGWCRYEAAINDILDDIPIWGLCLYDRRITPDAVLADVERTHPHLIAADGTHQHNHRYQDPATFLSTMAPPPLDPLEAAPPAVELVDPSPAAGRRSVRDIAQQTRLQGDEIDDLVTATSEAVTNATEHGRPPVTLRLWAAPERVVVTVNDRGDGPQDLHAGLVPRQDTTNGLGGFGLWLIHQLTSAATYTRDADGFTIHLTGGQALPLHHDAGPGPPFDLSG